MSSGTERHTPVEGRVRDNVFAGVAIDRMAERRDDRLWVEETERADDTRFLVLDSEGQAFVDERGEHPQWMTPVMRAERFGDVVSTLLGIANGTAWFTLVLDEAHAEIFVDLTSARRMSLREAGLILPAFEAGLFAFAKGITHWQRQTRFCSLCGAPTLVVASGHRVQCTNPDGPHMHFPRTDAAIIVIVEDGDRCLLGRQRGWPAGRYSTLAGFIEPGESLEDAVRREVREESGVEILHATYHSSQPWPLPASLMVGFTATARTREIILRDDELEDARWFTADDIVSGMRSGELGVPPPLSVSYRLIEHWLAQRNISLEELIASSPAR
ncbi:MAG: NAD(+) diphosphatase [Luteibacter sp.]|uniref:NAD(+) diphosphatase n=1 Tax=unclassified Luteibacter TaxID=2620188 RepID=UPI001EFA81F4|nr:MULTISPECIES: NAD(+) diphosphatase [unclassified Luteibacter]MDQ7994292.1 NAD(+) diphosphatase [Luteibacter sp.]MDQ8048592.1 NAD(+) diphosphatase [Luteibacter sp.]